MVKSCSRREIKTNILTYAIGGNQKQICKYENISAFLWRNSQRGLVKNFLLSQCVYNIEFLWGILFDRSRRDVEKGGNGG